MVSKNLKRYAAIRAARELRIKAAAKKSTGQIPLGDVPHMRFLKDARISPGTATSDSAAAMSTFLDAYGHKKDLSGETLVLYFMENYLPPVSSLDTTRRSARRYLRSAIAQGVLIVEEEL